MNKENRGAAGLRRSAIEARTRIREEWSALKEVEESTAVPCVLKKKPVNSRCTPSTTVRKKQKNNIRNNSQNITTLLPQVTSEILLGVVALVDVGSESRAITLRAVLTALGASVVMAWSPLVTHVVWTENGTRAIRCRARALACKLVSPLWVEACAAASRKLSEKMFPSASRQSDLPSPRTLRALLKKAERENVPLVDLLSDSNDKDQMPKLRLRISSGTDTSRDRTTDSSSDTIDLGTRINTAPRRGNTSERSTNPNIPPTNRQPPKSRRKLFTHKEAVDLSTDDESDTATKNKLDRIKLTPSEKRDLAHAERMAKKLLRACTQRSDNNGDIHHAYKYKIVLTGMSRIERQVITKCVQSLGAVLHNCVNKRTTHVLLGSCNTAVQCNNHPSNITGISNHCDLSKSSCWNETIDKRARTVSALVGGARGCRVLHARWAVVSAETGHWVHHNGYEVQHLKKISQKARVERSAMGHLNSDYAYDVFNGMRVRVSDDAEQRDAAIQLLKLCGAVVLDGVYNENIQNGGHKDIRSFQNGGTIQNGGHSDVTIGRRVGEVKSKWVFDSVAAARMRTTRRYINISHDSIENR